MKWDNRHMCSINDLVQINSDKEYYIRLQQHVMIMDDKKTRDRECCTN